MCLAGFIFAVQMAQWICHKLITHCARRVAVYASHLRMGAIRTVAPPAQSTKKFLIQLQPPTQQNLSGTEGKQTSSLGSLTTKHFKFLLIYLFPQKWPHTHDTSCHFPPYWTLHGS